LGPVLFIFYINDIAEGLSSTLKLYADDALMYCSVTPENNSLFQNDLASLSQWAMRNGMFFNTLKCHSIFFGRQVSEDIPVHTLCGVQLSAVTSFTYLGVLINQNLKWDDHISAIILKANRALGMLRRVLYKTPRKIKLVAYKTICRSLVEFSSEVWDPSFRKDIERLEMVQNRAVRFVCDLRGICSVSEARAEIELESLEERRRNQRKKFLLNLLAGENCHPALDSAFPELEAVSSLFCSTRSAASGMPSAVTCNSTVFHQSFLPRTSRELRLPSV
jgi:hypothetical protein